MSMRDAGILEGDLLAVHRTQEARTGQVVVARLARDPDERDDHDDCHIARRLQTHA